jgi:hypothetical protein
MIRWCVLGVLLACLAPAWGVGRVTGMVFYLRGEARVPVAGAQVRVGGAATTSAADGRFALDAPAGTQTLTVTAAHFRDPLTLPVTIVDGAAVDVPARLGQVYYLFVGIGAYTDPSLPVLQSATRDVAAMRKALMGAFWGDAVTLLDGQATKARIGDAFTRLVARMTPADYFVFYYSGHEHTETDGDIRYDFLQPVDSTPLHPERNVFDTEVAAWLARLPNPARALLIIDSCHAGGFLRGTLRAGELGKGPGDAPLPPVGYTLLAGAGAGEFSLDDDRGGFFTRALVGGLTRARAQADADGNRAVTATELFRYAAPAVTRAAKAVRERQHPRLMAGGDVVLLRY